MELLDLKLGAHLEINILLMQVVLLAMEIVRLQFFLIRVPIFGSIEIMLLEDQVG